MIKNMTADMLCIYRMTSMNALSFKKCWHSSSTY